MHLEPGQVAVVTGGASGLGLAMAQAFAAGGLGIVLADVEPDPLAAAVATLEANGAAAIGVRTDVRDLEQIEALADATLERFGRVDVICNNAGVSTSGPPTWETSTNDWDWVLGVNLTGVFNGIRAFVPHLVAQNSGHVVNTASMAGVTVSTNHAPYVASKHAVVALSEVLAAELEVAGADVGVTVVCPGVVETNIFQAERNRPRDLPGGGYSLTEGEIAHLVAWADAISGPPMSAEDAAQIVVDAVEAGWLHVAPNGMAGSARARCEQLLADLERA